MKEMKKKSSVRVYEIVRRIGEEHIPWFRYFSLEEAQRALAEMQKVAPAGEGFYLQEQWEEPKDEEPKDEGPKDEEPKRSKKRVYISGPITGRDPEAVVEDFHTMERLVNEQAGEVAVAVNPLHNGLPASVSWEEHMIRDLGILSECDAILYMHGGESSKGVAVEKAFARGLGLREFYTEMDSFENLIDWAKNG